MKILIPVAAYHEYNTAVYVQSAFERLGHEARVITQAEFYEDHPEVHLFFGVDSAGPLDFPEKHTKKTAMWFIDSRHNNNPERRTPDDDTNAKRLADLGGWVFQSQKRDWERCREDLSIHRCSWLPLAADPTVWRPVEVEQDVIVGFGGNVWDETRASMLQEISRYFGLSHITGTPEELVQNYGRSVVGFNVSSFFGTDVAYDINMRVFEVMACGIPLVTNRIQEMVELGMIDGHNCTLFDNLEGALNRIEALMDNKELCSAMGERGRHLIEYGHTYEHRMAEVLEVLDVT